MSKKKKRAKVTIIDTRLVPKPIVEGDAGLGTITIQNRRKQRNSNKRRISPCIWNSYTPDPTHRKQVQNIEVVSLGRRYREYTSGGFPNDNRVCPALTHLLRIPHHHAGDQHLRPT